MTTKSHGGARPGAGRKPKDRTPDGQIFDTAEEYLEAVVRGTVQPDPARIQAAKCLISYQRTKERAPKKSPTPSELAKREITAIESKVADEFERKAAEIRKKHARRTEK